MVLGSGICGQNILSVAIGAIRLAVAQQRDIDARVTDRSAAAVTRYGIAVNGNDLGFQKVWHGLGHVGQINRVGRHRQGGADVIFARFYTIFTF